MDHTADSPHAFAHDHSEWWAGASGVHRTGEEERCAALLAQVSGVVR